ncbi:hypothetical protein N7519_003931 [Penicillium mononematosum]|uniref:uncharacterized protein n=1 Tax=Penicillium mononematosum TaxID=268346 RepID=UPI0025491A6C|nr:uncharacterized protein N7519_003931 [Penicillium mononematosum]KAJ6189023.1 hypothetical protein N7519_003931 [Penicillium mononematosum]
MSPYSKSVPSLHHVNPPELYEPPPYYSHVISTTGPCRMIATAGQVGCDENKLFPEDMNEQIALAMENLSRALEAAGATVRDVYKLVYYMVDYDPRNKIHSKHLEAFLQGHRPATTLVPVPALASPQTKFEIEAYAAVPQEPLREVDVVVVGAGLSGLKAAWEVQKAGFSCVVVEARDRVGGKTYSVDPLGDGRKVDLGGAWINDTNQSEIYKLAQTLNLELVVQRSDGDAIFEDLNGGLRRAGYGLMPDSLAEPGAVEAIRLIIEETENACHKLDIRDPVGTGEGLDKLTLLEWAKTKTSSETALAVVNLWTRAMMGIEASEISALFFLNYMKSGGGPARMRSDFKHGAQYLRFLAGEYDVERHSINLSFMRMLIRTSTGSQSVSLGLVDLLQPNTVVLKSPVFRISQLPSGALVSSARGDFSCKRVIFSVQTILYKSITFDPPLPPSKLEIAKHVVQSCSFKTIIIYSETWWRKAGLSGAFTSFTGPVSTTRDTSNYQKGQYSLTCFANGDFGRRLGKYPRAERTKAILAHIKRVFGPYTDIIDPIAVVQRTWSKDLWSRVCTVPVSPPGITTLHEHALRVTHGKVHFVGTETAYEWKGYMDGAVSSGDRGAKEVIQALSEAKL